MCMTNKIEMASKKFNKLTVLHEVGRTKNGRFLWMCECDCGNHTTVDGVNLRSGKTKSCGCLVAEKVKERNTKHGLSKNPAYSVWKEIRKRTNNPNHKNYSLYGGRGITIDKRWNNFASFLQDMGERPSAKHSIDRVDSDGNYTKENCRWATQSVQVRNRRARASSNTGVQGVTKLGNKYVVRIGFNYKEKQIGTYDFLEDAIFARKEAESKYWKTT